MPGTEEQRSIPLDLDGREWLRIRVFVGEAGMTGFAVQYETVIGNKRTAVVRYDAAHGRPHRDTLNRRGDVVDKHWLEGEPTLSEAYEIGRQDLVANWRTYRTRFFGEEP